jgi:hypothetical protein
VDVLSVEMAGGEGIVLTRQFLAHWECCTLRRIVYNYCSTAAVVILCSLRCNYGSVILVVLRANLYQSHLMLLNVVTSTNILAAAALRLTCDLLTQFLFAHLSKALDLKTLLLFFGRSVLLSHPVLKLNIETTTASLHWVIVPDFLQRMPSEISVAKEQSITTNTNKLILYCFGVQMEHRF